MSALQTIRTLIRLLEPEERKVVRAYLQAFDSRGDEFVSKSLTLFDTLCREKTPAKDRDVEYWIYGKRKAHAWPQLLIRLREKILDAACLPFNVGRQQFYDERSRYLFKIRRKLQRAQFLVHRNHPDLADLEIETILELTEEIEAWEERLAALKLRLEMLHRWPDIGKQIPFDKLETQMWDCKTIVNQSAVAEILLYRIKERSLVTDSSLYQTMTSFIATVPGKRSVALEIDRELVKAYEFDFVRNNSVKAIDCLHRSLRLLEKQPLVKPAGYSGLIGLKLAEALLLQRRYHLAYEEAKEALKHLSGYATEATKAHELMFFAQCFRGDFQEAQNVLEVMDGQFPLNTPKRFCWFTYVHFAIGDFKEAEKYVDKMLSFSPKRGLTIQMQLLSLMNAAEMMIENPDLSKDTDKLFYKIKVQLQLDRDAFPREAVISEILFLLHKKNFSFKETFQASTEILDNLKKDERMKWQFMSDELIPFEEWFMIKVLKQDRIRTLKAIKLH